MADRKKRVLFISFDFPPRRTSGVYRMTGLAKYLPAAGWIPTVLSVRGPVRVWTDAELVEDQRLLERVPSGLEIIRTDYLDVRAWEDLRTRGNPGGQPELDSPAQTTAAPSRRSSLRRMLSRVAGVMQSLLYFPDPALGWTPYALEAASHSHRIHRFDAVFSSGPPRTSLLVGLLFKKLHRVPWTAEFMDPWYRPPGRIRSAADRWLQKVIVRQADRVVAVTEGHAAELRHQFGISQDKIAVVPNGYDEDDFRSFAVPQRPEGPLRLTHVGTIYPGHSGRFFQACADLLQESPELNSRLQIDVIGYPDEATNKFAHSAPLDSIITLHGYRPHAETLAAIARTDYLLLFLADREFARLCISGKTYEYMRTGKPILAVTYEGGIQKLLQDSGAGLVLPPDDEGAIKETLRRLLDGTQNAGGATTDFARQFGYDRLAAQLGAVLDETTARFV